MRISSTLGKVTGKPKILTQIAAVMAAIFLASVALNHTNFAAAQEPEIPAPCSQINHSPGQRSDCVVLLGLKDQLEGSRELNWSADVSFDFWTGVITNLNGVTRLYLNNRGLTEIPPELANLPHLEFLELSKNQLEGIPPELANLTRLNHLDLSENNLGEIPAELGGISSLETLYLHKGQLSGEIPPELGKLSNLKFLTLWDNQLSGEMPPELGNLSALEHLILWENQLSGEIPPELGNLSSLRSLDLGHNQLSGEIPPELANLSSLTSLSLYINQLSGEIPPELGNLSSLQTMDLSYNQLSGEIPPELGKLSNLAYLALSDNLYVVPIPRELGKLSNLATLDLSGNPLNGEIPPELGNLSSLQVLNLSHSIPIPELRIMKNLSNLTGCIPDALEDVPENYNWLLELPYCDNAPPVIGGPDPVFISVEHNTASGSEIGVAFTASDADSDSITWSLEGADAGLFVINADGQLSTATVVNKEESDSHTIMVKADDGNGGGTDMVTVRIFVTDVGEARVCDVDAGAPELPWAVAGTGYVECAVAPYSVSRQVIHFRAAESEEIIITNTTPEGKADLRLKNSDGKKFYANLTGRIAVGGTASATVEAGQWYALMLLGSADGQRITGTVAASAVNREPAFAEGSAAIRTVAENTAAETNIGVAVSASDPDGDTLTYSLGGTDAASFAMDAANGQLQVRESLDHETRTSYSVTITAADPSGATASIDVAISVTDVNEPPGKPAAPTVTAASSTSLNVSWNAPANTGPEINRYEVAYRAVDADWGHMQRATATTTVITGLKADTSYRVQVQAVNAEGSSSWSDKVTGSTAAPANSQPTITNAPAGALEVAENSASGAVIHSFTATDADGDSIIWSLGGTDAGLFAISASGQLSTAAVLDYEESASLTFTVQASDGNGGADTATVNVSVTDVDEDPECHVDVDTPALPWAASGTGYAECAVAPYSVSRQVLHFKAAESGEIAITNTTPEGKADLRLKNSDGKKFYANLTGRIAVGKSASATVVAGQWYALMLLGSAEGQAITGTLTIR